MQKRMHDYHLRSQPRQIPTAVNTVFQALQAGDHVIVPDDAYYELRRTLGELFVNWNLEHTQVDMTDLNAVQSAVQDNTRLIWIESPSNPLLKVSDVSKIATIAHQALALCVVDNTWCTPVLQRPLELGADAVMYSTTKYFGGHSDSLSGALVTGENTPKQFVAQIANVQNLSGAVPSAFDSWLITRGIKTMKLRMTQQMKNAKQLAAYLDQHVAVQKVHFPDLPEHPQHAVAKKQMPQGSGAMLSVQIGHGRQDSMAVVARLKLFTAATSLGGVESLVEHRRSVEGSASTTPENLIRISVGIEHIEDLVADWQQALEN